MRSTASAAPARLTTITRARGSIFFVGQFLRISLPLDLSGLVVRPLQIYLIPITNSASFYAALDYLCFFQLHCLLFDRDWLSIDVEYTGILNIGLQKVVPNSNRCV